MGRLHRLLFCLLLVSAFVCHTSASRADEPKRPRVILILFDGLTASDLSNSSLPHLRSLATAGQVGLMNTAVPGPRTRTSAILTLALGAPAQSDPTDAQIYGVEEIVERTTAENVYRRRIGAYPQPETAERIDVAGPIVHIGWAPLMRRGVDTRLFGATLSKNSAPKFLPVRGGFYGLHDEGREIGLFAVDSRGVAPNGALQHITEESGDEWLRRFVDNTRENLAIYLVVGEERLRPNALAMLDRLLEHLTASAAVRDSRIMLVSPFPTPASDGAWDRLSLVVCSGSGLNPGLLTSATTRTAGIVGNGDIAPTLLDWIAIPQPAEMTGRVMSVSPNSGGLDAIDRLDRQVYVNGRGLWPVFLAIAGAGVLIVVIGLWRRRSALAAGGVLALMAMPLAMVLAPMADVPNAPTLGLTIGCIMVLCALAASFRARTPAEPLIRIALATLVAVLLDAVTTQHLVRFSLLSSYQLQGIRYYGVGNEYMGVAIGFALLVAFLCRFSFWKAALLFGATAFVIGWPGYGANAGGVAAAVVAFGSALVALRGGRTGLFGSLALSALGLGAAFGLAFLDQAVNGPAASHLGAALSAVGSREQGWTYLWDIVVRKLAMNARIVVHPAVLAAAAAVAVIAVAADRRSGSLTQTPAWKTLAIAYPQWRDGLAPAAWGALAAFLFNDSGVVAALFLMGGFLASGTYLLFRPEPPRMG